MSKRLRIGGKSKYVIVRWLIHNQVFTHQELLRLPINGVVLDALSKLGWNFINSDEIEEFANRLRLDCPQIVLSKCDYKKLSLPQTVDPLVAAKVAQRISEKRRRKEDRRQRREILRASPKPKIDRDYSSKSYKALLNSEEWRRLRYVVLHDSQGKCSLCGRTRKMGVVLHVDHVVAASVDWSRRLDRTNLQVLCDDCNLGKSNLFSDDWR